jgi:hypothetical protein
MNTYIFVWFTQKGERQEYRTTALNMIIAQANYGSYQSKCRKNKNYIAMYQVINRKRIQL